MEACNFDINEPKSENINGISLVCSTGNVDTSLTSKSTSNLRSFGSTSRSNTTSVINSSQCLRTAAVIVRDKAVYNDGNKQQSLIELPQKRTMSCTNEENSHAQSDKGNSCKQYGLDEEWASNFPCNNNPL